uniref:Ragulator complex protein LAMTOR1 n=1 Tax=Chrysemys picta bellii TaxID=8478 RepID=A0A8C3H7B8_CHRPI
CGCSYTGQNLFSCKETKRLLEPVSPPNKVLNGADQNYPSVPSARTDEQAMLSSILAKTATSVLPGGADCTAGDSARWELTAGSLLSPGSSTRLAMLSNNLTHWKKLPPLPSLTSQPHQVLASETVPYPDLQQVRSLGQGYQRSLSGSLPLPPGVCPVLTLQALGITLGDDSPVPEILLLASFPSASISLCSVSSRS